jgi:putative DNA primase/helicase
MSNKLPPPEPPIVLTASAIPLRPMQWLWQGWIGRGVLTLLDGETGAGKSVVAIDLAARVSRGFIPPGSEAPAAGDASALILTGEDDPARLVRPRLEAAGADLDRVFVVPGPTVFTQPETLAKMVLNNGVSLVVVDPLQDFVDGAATQPRPGQARKALGPLLAAAQQTQAAVILVRRPTAGRQTLALQRGPGSPALPGLCWTTLVVGKDPGEPGRRVLAMSQFKVGPTTTSLSFALENRGAAAAVRWEGASIWNADEAVAPTPDARVEDMSRVEACAGYIEVLLQPGSVLSSDFERLCAMHGYGRTTVFRARKLLGVKATRSSSSLWEVALPQSAKSKMRNEKGKKGTVR